jgi:hypothetical protein
VSDFQVIRPYCLVISICFFIFLNLKSRFTRRDGVSAILRICQFPYQDESKASAIILVSRVRVEMVIVD